jgi:hypothetical protein
MLINRIYSYTTMSRATTPSIQLLELLTSWKQFTRNRSLPPRLIMICTNRLNRSPLRIRGPVVKILIMCGNEAYMKKITTDGIRRLYPDNKLEIFNVGENGEYFFIASVGGDPSCPPSTSGV